MTLNSFPRGGKKPNIKPSNTLFSKRTKIKNKSHKIKPKIIEKLKQDEPLVLNTAENLRYSALYEGMVILGRIYKVTDYNITVSLPGQISGKVQATDISENYTNLLKSVANKNDVLDEFKPLSEIYNVGDYIVCYVKELNTKTKGVLLSLEPHLINQNLNPGLLSKCSKVVLSVSSIEDHGYTLETGMKNFRAFLSTKGIGVDNINFNPGKQIICAIKDIKSAENVFTAKVSVKPKHLESIETNISFLNNLTPGAQYALTIKKILKNGLQVSFGEKNIGYINQIYLKNPLSSFEKGNEVVGTLLYIVPTIKTAYFSLLPCEQEIKSLNIGEVIPKATVLSHDTRGILVKLGKGIRGFIPLKRTETDYEKIKNVFTTNSSHKCKIIAYDSIAKIYICTMEKKLINKEYLNPINLKPGDVTKATVCKITEDGFINVSVGQNFGIVPHDQVSDPGLKISPKEGQKFPARVLEVSGRLILTLKKSLIESKLPILSSIQDAKVGSVHDGTIKQISNEGILVRFFNNIKGWIPKRFLNPENVEKNWNLIVGQTITTVIKSIKLETGQLTLALSKREKIQKIKCKIGDIVEGIVMNLSDDGVCIQIENKIGEKVNGFLPFGHMSPCPKMSKLLAAKTVSGDTISAIVFSTKPSLILSTTFAPQETYDINNLKINDLVLCSVQKIHKESLKVILPIVKWSKYGTILMKSAGNVENVYQNQILFGKITKIDNDTKEISLTSKLSEVWRSGDDREVKMMSAVDVLSSYLNKLLELSKNVYYTSKHISNIRIGQIVEGIVESVMDHGLVITLDKDIKGIVRIKHYVGKYKQGDKVVGAVLWINYLDEFVEVTLHEKIKQTISVEQNKLGEIPIGVQLRGEIVLVTNWFVLVILKGQGSGTLVALPSRIHLNDVEPDISSYDIGYKIKCFGVLNCKDADIILPICLLKSSFEGMQINEYKKPFNSSKLKRKFENTNNKSPAKKKQKKEIAESSDDTKTKTKTKNTDSFSKKKKEVNENIDLLIKKPKIEEQKLSNNDQEKEEPSEELKKIFKSKSNFLSMPECEFKWENSDDEEISDESSSESDGETEETLNSNKIPSEKEEKKSSINEQKHSQLSSEKSEKIEYLDGLVASNPNSSSAWIEYISHHLQATEIERARAVARRALRIINYREEEEKLNIWQAFLNLESKFGTEESLNDIFQEAVKTNDAQKVYKHMLTIHANAGRQMELEKTANTMIAKFKQDPETWISCGSALLKVGLKEKSRHTMQRALQSLPPTKHVDLMVRFAQIENKYGDKERSQTLYEQVLSSYPKRIDVWSSYVDSLIKSGDIEIARKVLDRAISQKLPAKKMKILFKKYISFEEKHGLPENVTRIRELAVKYIEEQCSKLN